MNSTLVASLLISLLLTAVVSLPATTHPSRYTHPTMPSMPTTPTAAAAADTAAAAAAPMRELLASKTGKRYVYLRREYIGERFCGLIDGECKEEGYAFFLVGIIAPCVVLAVVCLIAIPCFLIIRCCCAACSCCCGSKTHYKRNTIILVKAGLGAMLLGVLLAFYFGYAGNHQASDGIKGLTRVGLEVAQDLIDRIANIRARILQTSNSPPNAAADLQNAVDAGNDVRDTIKEADSKVDTVNDYRFAAINIGFIFPTVWAVLSFALGMANLRACWIHIIFAMFVLLALFFLWLSTGIHWVIEVLFKDLCFEARDFLFTPEAQRRAEKNPLQDIFHCDSNSTNSPFRDLANVLNDGIEAAVSVACTSLTSPAVTLPDGSVVGGVCNAGVDCSNAGYPSVPCSEDTLSRYQDSTLYSEREGAPAGVITLLQCTESSNPCVPGINRTAADTLRTSVNDIIIYRNILRGDVAPILGCDFLTDLLTSVDQVVCVDLVGGFGDIRKSQLAAAIFFLVAVVLMILGQKRFVPLSESLEDAEGDNDLADEKQDPEDPYPADDECVDALSPVSPAPHTVTAAVTYNNGFSSSYYSSMGSGDDYELPVYDNGAAAPPDYDSFAMMDYDAYQKDQTSHNFA